MIKRWRASLFLVLLLSSNAFAQLAFVEGADYQRLPQQVKTSQPDKIVVTEIFWYGCPHCFRFEPFAERWSAGLPDGVVFEQVPSSLNPRWTEHARAYYSFKYMNLLEPLHKKFFDAIHLKRKRLTDLDSIAEFVGSEGYDEQVFRETYFSFPVETQIRKNIQREKRYGHRGVPALVVNGKYLVSASMAGSNERMLEILTFLVNQERSL